MEERKNNIQENVTARGGPAQGGPGLVPCAPAGARKPVAGGPRAGIAAIVCLSALLLLCYVPSARADLFEEAVSGETDTEEEASSDTGSIDLGHGFGFDFNGHVRGDIYVGKIPGYDRAHVKTGYGEAALKLRISRAPYGDAFTEFRIRSGYLDGQLDVELDLREAYVNAYAGPVDIRFGHQIIVWGRADGVNPTNNLTPIDMRVRSPDEDDKRMGNLGLRMHLNFLPVRIEGVWMPLYSPSRLPDIQFYDAMIFDPDNDYPSTDLENGLLAGRFHLLFPEVEMSASYLHGYAMMPGFSLVTYDFSQVPRTVTLASTAWEQHVAGLDFSTTIGSIMGLRGEIAYRHPVDYEDLVYAPNPDLQYVLGVDREFGPVSIIAQYIGRYVFDWEELPEPDFEVNIDDLDSLDQGWVDLLTDEALESTINRELTLKNRLIHGQVEQVQHSVSLRIEWKTLHETLSLSTFGMFNISTLEWLLSPKIAYSITDAMSVTVGGEVYDGPEGTMFDMIDQLMSAGYAELKITF